MTIPERLDHLVYAAPSLEAGVRRIRALLGVEPVAGGSHPRWGTRNALVGLGPRRYLEVIAPDPELPPPNEPRPFGIDGLEAPRLSTWALRDAEPDATVARLADFGVELGAPRPGQRRRTDGTTLSWVLTDPAAGREGGVLPFLIDWRGSAHPADALAHGTKLTGLAIRHPEPERIRRILRGLGARVPVETGARPRLVATLEGPSGAAELGGPRFGASPDEHQDS